MDNVILEFVGNTAGAQIFRHPVSKNQIRVGQNIAVRFASVPSSDVDYYMSLGMFRIAHRANVSTPQVIRRDTPKRIEPIVEDTSLPSVPAVEEPTETVVSFDEEIDESLGWLSPEPVKEEVTEPVVEEVVEETPADATESQKTSRGRPRR